MALRVSGDSFQSEVLASEIPVLVEFYSDSCIQAALFLLILDHHSSRSLVWKYLAFFTYQKQLF